MKCVLFFRLAPGTLQVAWTWRITRRGKRLMSLIPYPIDPWLSPPYWYFSKESTVFVLCSWRWSVAESYKQLAWGGIVLHNRSAGWFLGFSATYNEATMCSVLCALWALKCDWVIQNAQSGRDSGWGVGVQSIFYMSCGSLAGLSTPVWYSIKARGKIWLVETTGL